MNSLIHHRHLQFAHIDRRLLAHLAHAPLTSFGAGLLLVSGEIEGDEEEEVGAKDADARERGELFAGAPAGRGEAGEISGGEVGIGGKVDESLDKSVEIVQ